MRPFLISLCLIVTSIVTCMAPTASSALQGECRFQDWLTTLYYLTETVTASPMPTHWDRLVDHRLLLASEDLHHGFENAGLSHLERPSLRFIDSLDQILPFHQQQLNEIAVRRISTSDWAAQLDDFRIVIARLDCHASGALARLSALDTSSHDPMPLGRFATMLMALNLSGLCFAYLIYKWLLRLHKIMQRHLVALPCKIEIGSTSYQTELIDISRSGAKVQINAKDLKNSKIKLNIGPETLRAKIVWRNPSFAGLRFGRILTLDQMERILAIQSNHKDTPSP